VARHNLARERFDDNRASSKMDGVKTRRLRRC